MSTLEETVVGTLRATPGLSQYADDPAVGVVIAALQMREAGIAENLLRTAQSNGLDQAYVVGALAGEGLFMGAPDGTDEVPEDDFASPSMEDHIDNLTRMRHGQAQHVDDLDMLIEALASMSLTDDGESDEELEEALEDMLGDGDPENTE